MRCKVDERSGDSMHSISICTVRARSLAGRYARLWSNETNEQTKTTTTADTNRATIRKRLVPFVTFASLHRTSAHSANTRTDRSHASFVCRRRRTCARCLFARTAQHLHVQRNERTIVRRSSTSEVDICVCIARLTSSRALRSSSVE